jgi:sugar phosphate isomerase/epimerase
MKFAFSTLSCPQWTVEQIADNAVRMGYSGVELRLLDGKVIDPVSDAEKVRKATSILRARGIEICAFDTSCLFNLKDPVVRAKNVEDLRAWIRLARELQVPMLRIFGGAGSGEDSEQQNVWVVEALRQVAQQAEEADVIITLETHDGFASSYRVAKVLEAIDSPSVAALWDSHHPYRKGETAEEVWQQIGTRVAHVHVKDARRDTVQESGWQLVLLGEGEVPVREQLQTLHDHNYTGYISVEWEKHWHSEIEEPEIALPQHITWLRKVEKELQVQ